MGKLYLSSFGSVLYSSNYRKEHGECLEEAILMGEDMFNTLYPEAHVGEGFFESLLKFGDGVIPSVNPDWFGSGSFTLLWSCKRGCWVRWDDDGKTWRDF